MQPSPSQQGYDDGRWRSSIESKLDKALDLLTKLDTAYQLLNSRVTILENKPKEQAQQQALSLNKIMAFIGAGGCLYMLVSVGITIGTTFLARLLIK